MDTTDKDIVFDDLGYCNHCNGYFENLKKVVRIGRLDPIMEKIKASRKGKYDCILGISGGTDSSMVAYLAKSYGLNPLLFHLDNTWDSAESEHNVQRILGKTGFDFDIAKSDWETFRDLQLAFLKSSVINIEMITDQALAAVTWKKAMKLGVHYILNGSNYVTEAIMPRSWGYRNDDVVNIKNIHKAFGKLSLKNYPMLSLQKIWYYRIVIGIAPVSPLNFIDYKKAEAKETLTDWCGWKDYGTKHGESVWTRFYQGYILPTKFRVDKRRAHLSTLICSGQMSRNEALKELEKLPYEPKQFESDKKMVLEKLELTEDAFEEIMKLPIQTHQFYGTDERTINILRRMKRILK